MVMIDEEAWLEERGLLKKETPAEQIRNIHKALPIAVARMQLEQMLPKPQETYIYFVLCGDKVKIGKARRIYSRLHSMQTGNPEPLTLYGYVLALDTLEQEIHQGLQQHRYRGEWFWWNDEVKKTAHRIPRFVCLRQ